MAVSLANPPQALTVQLSSNDPNRASDARSTEEDTHTQMSPVLPAPKRQVTLSSSRLTPPCSRAGPDQLVSLPNSYPPPPENPRSPEPNASESEVSHTSARSPRGSPQQKGLFKATCPFKKELIRGRMQKIRFFREEPPAFEGQKHVDKQLQLRNVL